ncbi:response regulator [Salibaculum griseiflavum]|uniref:Response regulatory domain-containing protein n=1 Tax=Salibaculum griseiflavum TaxID=1914409 RepID=A0A2V1P6W1_9RHOB|nr:response regulator [Salibaculum griseiflavum]PWG16972.1 hypothetical protein DFK10_09395 [Salibaculum griseiflavum]
MKILIVDDDDFALELLGSALSGAGYTDVTAASSGEEALGAVAHTDTPFDIFLLDIQMPGMDGIELCARLRKMAQYASTPIIMITAMQERRFIDQAFAAGAMDYVNKPFDPIELGVRISLAARLSNQAKKVDAYATEAASLKARTGMGAAFGVDEPIALRDVPRVISMTAMENYLLRLTYWMAIKSQSVVFSIPGFREIHARIDPSDAYDILSDTAAAITVGFKHTDHLVTYVGNGQFVVVVSGKNTVIGPETLWSIEANLEQDPPLLSSGEECPIRLVMGEVFSPGIWSAPNRLNLLLRPLDADLSPAGSGAEERARIW